MKNPDEIAHQSVRTAYGNLACMVCIFCNVLLFVGKFTVGTLFGSVAVTADAVNNLSDASSNVVSLLGFKLAAKPADSKHPYGHARYEYLAGLAVAVMILVIGIELLKESMAKVIHPTTVTFSIVSILILVGSIAVKLWMSVFNKNIGGKIHSETLLATAADARNDVISTAAVLFATLAVHFSGMNRLDGIMGLFVAAFILWSGVGIVRDTLDPILGAAPDPAEVSRIEKKVMTYPGVLGMHDLMIHDYGPGNRLVSFHIEMSANGDIMESHDLIDSIEKDFLVNDGLTVTIHFDPIVTDDPHVVELRSFIHDTLKALDPHATAHDLRIVPGPTHTNVIFDLGVPPEYISDKEHHGAKLMESLREAVSQRWPNHFCVITLETDYAAPGIEEE